MSRYQVLPGSSGCLAMAEWMKWGGESAANLVLDGRYRTWLFGSSTDDLTRNFGQLRDGRSVGRVMLDRVAVEG